MSKPSRWLNLVAFLLSHRFAVTRDRIFEAVDGYGGETESARRKFERDKDELRALGIEIETVPLPGAAGDEPATGYRLRARDTYLPYLELTDQPATDRPYGLDRLVLTRHELALLDRATSALAGLADSPLAPHAASARRKLAFDLPLPLPLPLTFPLATEQAATLLALPIPDHARDSLALLQDAVIDRATVACRYFTMSRRAESERELEPWGLLFQWGRWYCVARARDRDEPRTFRIDRMRNVRRLPGPAPHFTVPDEFDVRAFTARSPWEFGAGDPTRARVRFAFPESGWVLNSRVGQLVSDDAGRGAEIAFDVRDDDAFLKWLLSFGRRATLLDPPALGDALERLRADVAARYAEAAP